MDDVTLILTGDEAWSLYVIFMNVGGCSHRSLRANVDDMLDAIYPHAFKSKPETPFFHKGSLYLEEEKDE